MAPVRSPSQAAVEEPEGWLVPVPMSEPAGICMGS